MDRKEAADLLDNLIGMIEDSHGADYDTALKMGIEALKDAQPEIIRCEDCDWWTKQADSLQGRCARHGIYPTGEWFCAGAERREVTKQYADVYEVEGEQP